MKKIFGLLIMVISLGALIMVISLGAQASLAIHSGCSDRTYAYNRVDITELDDSIKIRLSGATVFKLTGDWEPGATSNFSIDKSNCKFSNDKRLFSCKNIAQVNISRSNKLKDFLKERYTRSFTVKNLTLEMRYVESVSWAKAGFELSTQYKIEGGRYLTKNNDGYVTNSVLFHGSRDLGCSNIFW